MCRLPVYALFLLLGSFFLGRPVFANAGQVNITVDDTDPLIVYQPTSAWFYNQNSLGCAVCLTPPSPTIAYNSTWHHGLHVIPLGANERDSSGRRKRNDGVSTMSLQERESDLGDARRDNTFDPTNGVTASPFDGLDSGDPGFVDIPVSVRFNFNGSAIYLYCILPLGVPPTPHCTPTHVDLTFTLDDEPAGKFSHDGLANIGGFQPNVSVFSRAGLSDSAHTLVVNLGPNSVFLLDHYVFSQADGRDLSPTSTTAIVLASSRGFRSNANSNRHNIETFAGAVGGSVGVLATIAACLAFSIYRRRRRSARQQQQDRERQFDAQSFRTDASDDTSPMDGPALFIPRYFPGTVPLVPPPYVGPAEGSSLPSTSDSSSTGSYHHIPPTVPIAHRAPAMAVPSTMHDAEPLDTPPPFSVAIASPEPPVLANVMRRVVPQIIPPGLAGDAEPVPPEVSPIVPTVTVTPPPRPLRRPRSNNLPSIDSPTSSSLLPDLETRSLPTEISGSRAEITLPQAGNDHSVALDP
ncbi:hypothetical protein BJV78DRAFT_1176946 [Lactifluus subvellereus]|nr:hypothetical protein BJV78DRAFT_1176946 [Lactifluus subvellereus]